MSWVPRPLDTNSVTLPPHVEELTEFLAEHIHDIWAARRIGEGWRPGQERDDAKRTHPGLVPYAELPDSEKEYDRATALDTVRALYALGYRVVPADTSAESPEAG